jgi:glycosyltransferase involved in cell wall biosynthesis
VHRAWAEAAKARFTAFVPFNFPLFKKNGALLHLSALLKGLFLPRADVYLLESPMMVTALLPRLLFFRPKIIAINSDPFFFSARGYRRLVKKYFDWLLTKITGIVSTSELMANAAKTYKPLPRSVKHTIVPIFIDTQRFAPAAPDTATENFCFIGPHLNAQKGVDRLIKLFRALNPQGKLYLIGNATSEIEDLAAQDHRVVITGRVPDPAEYLNQCAYYLNLARLEPAGANILEAMSAGFVPVVSKDCGVAPIVAQLSPKLVVDADKLTAVRFSALKPLLRDAALSQKARTLAKNFSQATSVRAFASAFSKLQKP